MDQSAVQRLQNSFALLAPRGQELVDRFYANLFARQPRLRPMFPRDMAEQKKKLLASLMLVVKNLSRPERLRNPLLDLGRRHAEYRARPEHYPILRDILVAVMGSMSGGTWTSQLETDWKTAIDFVASIMMEGAAVHVHAAGPA